MSVQSVLSPEASLTLHFGSDLHLRNRWFVPESISHPAKLHLGLLQWIVEKYTRPGDVIADPMAGIGSMLYAATLQRAVIAQEIEPRWLEIAHRNVAHIYHEAGLFAGQMHVGQHDARLPWPYQVNHIIFSPPYGNEASTTPTGRRMLLYRLSSVAVPLSERWKQLHAHPTRGAMGALSFHYGTHPAQIGHYRGKRYYQAVTTIYASAYESLRDGGLMILILKDHIANGVRVQTAQKTRAICQGIGFSLIAHHRRVLSQLSLWQRRRKEVGLPVVEEEDVLVFCKESEAFA